MRKILFLFLCALLPLPGCAPKAQETDMVELTASAPAERTSQPQSDETSGSGQAAIRVLDTVAYIFEGDEGAALYGAAVYENTGDQPCYLQEASFSFTLSEQTVTEVFQPALASYDVVLPGERAYAAGWFSHPELSAGAAAELRAELACVPCAQSRIALAAEDIFLADNYPGFTTMTGTLVNESGEGCALNMIYAAFYGAEDDFLGVWYFSRNAWLDSSESVRFVTHMKALPLEELSQRAVRTECRAFGFN